ncbi:putative peptidoglycan bound protein [Halarchaeum acidiphilum MH1-52-1]|uniref:Putative peptidoglycan bound protein n=1 Tax=Halarchaeum acidiphilum MH1-52-1 TaxID=1261545 RepID=U3A146_9EURY|nr:hypothetical protein [Halarchaeum acidiphilum]GAD51344.1 putative peptidoglycan bound protein [Halarchaeum acidiphilum MH1-52-1]
MAELDIGASQAEYLEELREALADEHLDGYGAMRPRDALQYLIDRHEATRPADDLVPDVESRAADGAAADDEPSVAGDDTLVDAPGVTPVETTGSDDETASMPETSGEAPLSPDEAAAAVADADADADAASSASADATPDAAGGASADIDGGGDRGEEADGSADTGIDADEETDADEDASAADSGRDSGGAGTTTATAVADDASPSGPSGSPLRQMMALLEEHDDAWEEVDSSDGKYVVTLPDGSSEHARTRDDVRALLFKHYR